ncbi:MAG: hypothetical protein A2189_09955 [Paenibacillus sp. RIFOXYA1_FULL_44_5]|nr:MAG: hypothetical protein A2189_09955 [Paenibacillus sp. RIFOXYA1_FULL_44_5]
MINKKAATIFAVLIMLIAAFSTTGCGQRISIKQNMEKALEKQETAQTYHFTGKANISIQPVNASGANSPLTETLLQMLSTHTLTWAGAYSKPDNHMEVQLHLPAGNGSSTPIDIPLLMKDNNMYIHLPVLNEKDEYMIIPLNNQNTSNSLVNSGQLLMQTMNALLESVDENNFSQQKTESDETNYKLTISEKQQQKIAADWSKALPGIIEKYVQAGLLQKDFAQKNSNLKINLTKPGSLQIIVDPEGWILEESMDIQGELLTGEKKAADFNINYQTNFDKLNQQPEFELAIPTKTKPLTEIMKFIKER